MLYFHGFEHHSAFVSAILTLNEIIKNRHGIMVIGPPMSGKSEAIRIIAETYNMLHK
jgi:ABC-type polar amino acid transport system ATPase subunit